MCARPLIESHFSYLREPTPDLFLPREPEEQLSLAKLCCVAVFFCDNRVGSPASPSPEVSIPKASYVAQWPVIPRQIMPPPIVARSSPPTEPRVNP